MNPEIPRTEIPVNAIPITEAVVIVDWEAREQTARAYDRLAAPELRAESLHAVADLLAHNPDDQAIRKFATGVKLRELWAVVAAENVPSEETLAALERLGELAPKRSGLLALLY